MTDLVLTIIGQDRPGLVEAVAAIVRAHGGNWVESRMTRLGGKFAGILRAEMPADRVAQAVKALGDLEARGLKLVVETEAPNRDRTAPGGVLMDLDVVGVDRPGIVQELTQLLSLAEVNVEEMTTDRRSAPMSGETLFEAHAVVRVPQSTDVAALRDKLDQAAKDLVVDVRLENTARRGT